ncbi:MAG: 50S ribosomal protein L18 [Patescibacteria group bacterium]
MDTKIKKEQRDRRRKRIRAKIFGTSKKPRLSVFRSNKYITAQLIDDIKGNTLASAIGQNAKVVGADLATKAKAKKIVKVVFDRGGYIYTGKVATLAESAREAGLKF